MSGTPLPEGGSTPPADPLRDEVAQLHEAVKSQRDIGMAIGLLSARYACSTEQAWRTIVRVSQDSNTKVRAVARVLVSTHDGTASEADRETLARFVAHLPASGWPEGQPAGE
ncbi:ANTAR domain-containing protein [Nocardioides sp. zg-1228]|uniref:ANTAR domain-containing protein n=1 Tax=Nocardioides sp. zg-1228 TaxID=2763008 RepID=UPI00164323A6|nr:ANTAR domain-containing protein [Nocardioides sp. zg-1228]MBC2932548.1 ANTAR domain-containing protein [Nocardioides sp. zg-1228]QSF58046.1 ANTAR domain-containing protein [Nocardioides sp. zg-1228]